MPTLIVASLGLTGVTASIVSALISFAISYISQSLFAPDAPETPPDQGVTARIPTDPKNKLPVIYGEQRSAGQTVFADISSDNQTMYFIIALCEGPVEAIDSVTWEDKTINFADALSGDLQSPTAISNGVPNPRAENTTEATKGAAVDPNGIAHDFLDDNIRVAVFPNGGDCTPLTSAKSPRWDVNRTNRTFPNTAYAYVELDYNREDRVTGLPGKLYFNVKGRTVKTLDTTDNSLNAATTSSSNPVDNLIDYLTNSSYGCDLSDNDLGLDSFSVHKNFCNGQLPFQQNSCVFPSESFTTQGGTGAGFEVDPDNYNSELDCEQAAFFVGTAGSRTATTGGAWTRSSEIDGDRYTTNGILSTNNELDRNISDLTVGNGAALTYNLGKFGLISEGVQSVAQRSGVNVSFSEDDIIGKIDITGSGFDAVLNEVTLKFVSIRQRYQQEQVKVTYNPALGANLIQNPNEPRLEKTLQLPFTNNNVEAERIGRVIINDSRQALIVSFQANINNTDLQAGDIIEISHATPGWIDKQFRVQQVDERVLDQENSSIGVSIIAREYAEEVYNSETILLQDPAPNTNLPNPLVVQALNTTAFDEDPLGTGVNASTVLNGVPTSQILVSWDDATSLDLVEVRYFLGNITATQIAALAYTDWTYTTFDGGQISGILTNLEPSTTYQIQARARNTLGALGTFGPIGDSKLEATTIAQDAIEAVEVNILSSDGVVFKNNSGTSTLTAEVSVGGNIVTDSTLYDTYTYRWNANTDGEGGSGGVVCVDSNVNVVGIADTSLDPTTTQQGSDPDSLFQAACESAGGIWVGGNSPGVSRCTSDGVNTALSGFSSLLGCSVTNQSRGDSENFNGDLSFTATEATFRTINVDANDVDDNSTAQFTCTVGNI